MSEQGLAEFERVAQLIAATSEQLTDLPSIAYRDWPDLAARCFCRACPGSHVAVLVGRIDESGGILGLDASGVAIDGAATDSQEHLELKGRVDRLASLGFHIDLNILQARSLVGGVESLTSGRDWRAGPLGRLYGFAATGNVVVGVGALGTIEPGRSLIVLMGQPAGSRDMQIIKMRALLPVALRKALVAIGPRATRNEDWITECEQNVLEHLIEGESVKEIAENFKRSPHTIHDHVKALHRKLKASSRGELVARALGHVPAAQDPRRRPQAADAGPIAEMKPAQFAPAQAAPARPA